MKKTVVVGMSGGVDSSVAAALLIEQGYNVIGLFMKNWDEQTESGECSSAADWQDALNVCGCLGIACYSVNFAKEYMDRVFSYFLSEYKAGRTPNPDVLCNREIKFAPFKQHAIKLGADFIATGHYCGVMAAEGGTQLIKAADSNKDQTYFLNQVSSSQLDNVLFPLANMHKDEVRAVAAKYGFITAKKKDSTGICFIGERKFRQFLSNYLPGKQGDIVDTAGRRVGRHEGLMYYTLGQRKGLGIGGIEGESGRWYVVDKKMDSNRLVVSCGEGEELLSNSLLTEGFNFIGQPPDLTDGLECHARFRYRQGDQAVKVKTADGGLYIEFAVPQRAITPGQYAVLYSGNRCLGGGIIKQFFR